MIASRAFRQTLFASLLLVASGAVTPLRAETIKVGGTGAAMAAMQVLADEFQTTHPDADIEVMPAIGSSGAIKGVKSGIVAVGVSGRTLKDGETGKDIEETELARTPFVFVVPTKNSMVNITEAELIDIYAGKRTSWPDGSRLRLILRPSDDSDTEILMTKFSPAMSEAVQAAEARPGMLFASTDQECAELLGQTPGALGVLTLGQVVSERLPLRALQIDGIEPSVTAAANGTYRYYKVLHLLISPDAKPMAREFHSFAQSARGQELLEQLGFWISRGNSAL